MVSETERDIKLSEEQVDVLQNSLSSVGTLAIILNTFWEDIDDKIPQDVKAQLLLMLMNKTEIALVE